MKYYTAGNSCCKPSDAVTGGGDKYYEFEFSGSISLTILGTAHNFQRIPDVKVYRRVGANIQDFILAHVEINPSHDVTVTFKQIQTGVIILT